MSTRHHHQCHFEKITVSAKPDELVGNSFDLAAVLSILGGLEVSCH
jgi:hypothetical protein